jgi:hypothetical protein|tara:strand:+ start:4966 stop:5163 length:198 start_codon:yes stop_codon:yes gene_type:complete
MSALKPRRRVQLPLIGIGAFSKREMKMEKSRGALSSEGLTQRVNHSYRSASPSTALVSSAPSVCV